jgi:hypothetical protein
MSKRQVKQRIMHADSSNLFLTFAVQGEIVREGPESFKRGKSTLIYSCTHEELPANTPAAAHADAADQSPGSCVCVPEPGHVGNLIQCVYPDKVARSFGINRREVCGSRSCMPLPIRELLTSC